MEKIHCSYNYVETLMLQVAAIMYSLEIAKSKKNVLWCIHVHIYYA
jgi:hypothetical protein